MRLFLFLSRVALICNFFFLLTVLLHFKSFVSDQAMISTIVVMGYFMAIFLFSPLVNLLCLMFIMLGKPLFTIVPKWLVITNFIFLLTQILFLILFFNDSLYN